MPSPSQSVRRATVSSFESPANSLGKPREPAFVGHTAHSPDGASFRKFGNTVRRERSVYYYFRKPCADRRNGRKPLACIPEGRHNR